MALEPAIAPADQGTIDTSDLTRRKSVVLSHSGGQVDDRRENRKVVMEDFIHRDRLPVMLHVYAERVHGLQCIPIARVEELLGNGLLDDGWEGVLRGRQCRPEEFLSR
jgi:hypothetical protein